MQGFDPQTILPRIAAQGLERQEIRPGDWFDDDGMLMCGKCGEPRQGMVTVSAPMEGNPENKMTFKATRSCKCDRDKEAAEKQAEQNKKDMERVARLKKASLMDEKLREAFFDSFQVTKYNARNLKLCRRYAEAFDEMVSKNQGLIFWGSVGTGTMRWGSHPITSSTAIIWATRTRRTNRSPAVATPFARRWLRLLQGPTSPNTSPKWATPSRQWPPCWTWWRCRKEQDMDKKKLMELAERYQHKADTAFQNYQETGITRYDTARRNNEDMAEALRMAASAKEDHDRMIHLRGVLSQLAWRAAEANRASEEERPRKMQAVLGELLSAARMQGLIRDEGGDFK